MKIIPAVRGSVREMDGKLPVILPISYTGAFDSAALFPLEAKAGAVLTFKEPLPAEGSSKETKEVCAARTDEGYHLTVSSEGIVIEAATEEGKFYGMTTLMALINEAGSEKADLKEAASSDSSIELPFIEIEDAPKYAYRGLMLDCGRHFFSVEEIKKLLKEMACLKLNKFHWHLSEDQGFRIESKKFPRLNEIGSCRNEADGTVYAYYYTQEEIKDIVAFAAARKIEVIPEIDLPGHTTAIVASMPELSCSGEPVIVPWQPGIHPRILCAGKETVYQFLEALLDEILPLFPGQFFHLGGDEAPKGEWKKCPDCQAAIRRMGLKDEEALQASFTKRLVAFLESRGKRAIGWNEILMSDTLESNENGPVVQFWNEMTMPYSYKGMEKGFRFVFSDNNCFYLDYDPALVTMKAAYVYEPCMPGADAVPDELVLGLEAPLWSEFVLDSARLETQIFPRLTAMAENAWTHAPNRDFDEFVSRLEGYMAHLASSGFAVRPLDDYIIKGMEGLQRFFAAGMEMAKRFGAAGQSVSMPPEVAAQIKEAGMRMMTGLMKYTFTPEEIQMAFTMMQSQMGGQA